MYKIINKDEIKKINQYNWFRKFSNPCYGFNVKMDVTKLVAYSKKTNTSFFINTLYLICKALNTIEEMHIREVDGEIRIYDVINPAFTVMLDIGIFENVGFEMIEEYQSFYDRAHEIIERVKKQKEVKKTYNDSNLYNDFYITCIPWLSIEGMTHPLIDNDYASLSCPRICWDKFHQEGDKILMTLNITVNHCFFDGYPLSLAFKKVQTYFDDVENLLKR